MTPIYILHIETSTLRGSVALSRGDLLVDAAMLPADVPQAAALTPAIKALLAGHGLQAAELGALSVSSGPGSYTGLRVGSSTAKAMAYSLGIPLVGVESLLALATAARHKQPDADFFLPMIDARRMEVYTCLYDRLLQPQFPVSAALLEDPAFWSLLSGKGNIVICGDGAGKVGDPLAPEVSLVREPDILADARHLVAPAREALAAGNTAEVLRFVPDYLKPPHITRPKNLWVNP